MKEIIIVGTGITGLLTAHYFKKAGYAPLVIANELPGIGQSHGNARLLRYYAESSYMHQLTVKSNYLFKELEEHLGVGTLLGKEGLVYLAKDKEELNNIVNFNHNFDIDYKLIKSDDINNYLSHLNPSFNYKYALIDSNTGILRTEKILHHLTVDIANNFILDTIDDINIKNNKIFLQGITDNYEADCVVFASSYNNHIFLEKLNLESKYSNFTAHIRATFSYLQSPEKRYAIRDGVFEVYGLPIYDSDLFALGISKTGNVYNQPPSSLYPSNLEINKDKERLLEYIKQFKNINPKPVHIRQCWTHQYNNSQDYSEIINYKNAYFICGYNNWKNAPALADITVNQITNNNIINNY